MKAGDLKRVENGKKALPTSIEQIPVYSEDNFLSPFQILTKEKIINKKLMPAESNNEMNRRRHRTKNKIKERLESHSDFNGCRLQSRTLSLRLEKK